MRKTTVRQHTRKVRGCPVPVVRHERSLPPNFGRVGVENRAAYCSISPATLFMKPHLTREEVQIFMLRLNTRKLTPEEVSKLVPEGGWTLEQEKVTEQEKWLKSLWKTRLGFERVNNPFGYRGQTTLRTFRTVKLIGSYSTKSKHFYPLYRAEGTEGSFTYSIVGGQIKLFS